MISKADFKKEFIQIVIESTEMEQKNGGEMSILVKTFDMKKVKELLKTTDPYIRRYIDAHKEIIKMQEETNKLAIKKINELSKQFKENN